MSDERSRRSAKQVITDMAEEILRRPSCDENKIKLNLIETIANRMGWSEIVVKLKYAQRDANIQRAHWYQD